MSVGGRKYRPVMDGEDIMVVLMVLFVLFCVFRALGVIGG